MVLMTPSACRRRSVYLAAPHRDNREKRKLSTCRSRRRFSLRPGANPNLPVTISFVDGAVSQKQNVQVYKERSLRHRRFSLRRRLSDIVETSFRKASLATSKLKEDAENLFLNPWTTPPAEMTTPNLSPPSPSTQPNIPPRFPPSKRQKHELPVERIDISLPTGTKGGRAQNNVVDVVDVPHPTPTSMALKGAYIPVSPFSTPRRPPVPTTPSAKIKFRRYEAGSSIVRTVWYESCSPAPVSQPVKTPAMSAGDIFLHFHHQGRQVWVLNCQENWVEADDGFYHPQDNGYTLRIRSTGEPIWFKRTPNNL